jgi:GT2 family glycosyltransferase
MSASVAVVIVTYNSAREIEACLRSLDGVGEVVVIDNASQDDTCRRVQAVAPQARLIRNPSNLGFAAAVNQGIRATANPLVLLLNPDTVLRGSLEPMERECLSPEVGAVAGQLVDALGVPQIGFNVRSFPTPFSLAAELLLVNRLWPSNPLNRRYRRLDLDPVRRQDVEQPAGAFLMVKREVFDQIGPLDEGFYPIWFEDVDLCLRIRKAGYTIRYVPGSVAEHQGAHSVRAMPLEQKQLAWYCNLLRFVEKHYSPAACFALRLTAGAGLAFRWSACMLKAERRSECQGYEAAMKHIVIRRPDDSAQVNVPTTAASRSG